MLYFLENLGIAVFAITGVLAVRQKGVDVFGAVVLGVVTAIGGGTIRDTLLGIPVYWIRDFTYAWSAIAAALLAFFLAKRLQHTFLLLLYLDGLGAALFGVTAAEKVLSLSFSAPVAVLMGLLTSIGGGIMRDTLAGRPSLLMSRELYATPILLGCSIHVLTQASLGGFWSGALALTCAFGLRATAIHRHLEMPGWLSTEAESE